MKELVNYILQFGNLNQQQIDLIASKAEEREIRKEHYFAEAGKVAAEVGFIVVGIMRVW